MVTLLPASASGYLMMRSFVTKNILRSVRACAEWYQQEVCAIIVRGLELTGLAQFGEQVRARASVVTMDW